MILESIGQNKSYAIFLDSRDSEVIYYTFRFHSLLISVFLKGSIIFFLVPELHGTAFDTWF